MTTATASAPLGCGMDVWMAGKGDWVRTPSGAWTQILWGGGAPGYFAVRSEAPGWGWEPLPYRGLTMRDIILVPLRCADYCVHDPRPHPAELPAPVDPIPADVLLTNLYCAACAEVCGGEYDRWDARGRRYCARCGERITGLVFDPVGEEVTP